MRTVTSILSGIETRHQLRNPKPSHFKVVKNRGIFHRVVAGGDGQYRVQHKKVFSLQIGPFATKQAAKDAIPLIVEQMKLANASKQSR